MILYIYLAHLIELEWHRFGQFRTIEVGQSDRLSDYLRSWDLDPAFEHLRRFTFSEAMLSKLDLYLLVGTPVAIVLYALETDRVRWLQAMATERLAPLEASRACRWFQLYLWALACTFTFIISLGFFHLGTPRAHYICAAGALTSGCGSVTLYLMAPLDFNALARSGEDPAFEAWSLRVLRWVRPLVKVVLALHVVAAGAAVWKAESLGDDAKALLFGVAETSVIVGYQVFQGIMVVDDLMVGRSSCALEGPLKARAGHVAKSAPQPCEAPARGGSSPTARDCRIESPWSGLHERLLGL